MTAFPGASRPVDGRRISSVPVVTIDVMNDHQRRIARARLLRREGKTYDEIRAVLGPASKDQLERWLRGIARPPETYRSCPKPDLRRDCRRLRANGHTYEEIAARTGASKGSLSLWLRDVRGAPSIRQRKTARPSRRELPYARAARAAADCTRAKRRTIAAHALGSVSARELLMAGVALYLAEGSKAKPWRPRDRQVVFINSDPAILYVFLAWLDLIGVAESRRTYRLSIHESADTAVHEAWWAKSLGLDVRSFRRASLKRHKPLTVRKNTGDNYHGCLVVRVLRPAALYDAVEGWWQRLVCESTALRSESVGCSQGSPGWSNGMTRPFGGLRWGFESSPGS
ncbi:MAG: hypothetical protein QOJ03_3220 [Frankiaceae bacterium]|nr:hypothetical protein [Frankiaceae bacterium]